MKIAGIYIIKNLINNKFYIGSSINIKRRFIDHKRDLKSNKHASIKLQRAYHKYGETNFSFIVLEQLCLSKLYDIKSLKETIINKEQFYLDSLLFANEDNNKFHKLGYNILRKADSSLGAKHSTDTKNKLSIAHKKKWNNNSYRKKMSIALKGVNSGNKREDLKKYNINNKSKKVYQYDLNGIFIKEWPSAREASRKLNIDLTNIARAANNKIKQSNGFLWRYIFIDKIENINLTHISAKPVIQYTIDNIYIKEWNSCLDAEKNNKITNGKVSMAANGLRKTAGGYIWKYKETI